VTSSDSAAPNSPPAVGDRIRLERDGDLLIATISHPTNPMNVVDEAMHHQLRQLMAVLRADQHARAIVLRAEGRAFCAGGDFAWFPELRSAGALEALRHDAKAIIWDLLEVRAPIICALNGHAMGLGASIALLCDSIVMAETAKLGDPHVKVGLVAGDGGAAIWPLAVGPTLAKRYLMTGDPLNAAQCLSMGLVTDVCPAADVDQISLGLARKIAANPPLAVQYTKAAVNQQLKAALLHSFDISAQSELVTFLSQDHIEAVQAAVEQRPGIYNGR
jgi:enoyl-CoA hydratase